MICARLLSRFSLRDLYRSRYIFTGELPERRLHAYRYDLIDERLRERFADAPSYMFVAGEPMSIIYSRAYLRRTPSFAGSIDTELFYGNEVRCFAQANGWSWVQSGLDGYVGYVPSVSLGEPISNNAIVSVALCLCYREADVKSESFCELAMGSRLSVADDFSENGFRRARMGDETAYISERHIISLKGLVSRSSDFVSSAEQFMDAPYLYGGGCYAGIDCSALLQTSMGLHGIACPRDADLQEGRGGEGSLGHSLGHSLGITDSASVDRAMRELRRGDLIFWNRHVGIMLDEEDFVHANAGFMCVSRERLSDARARIMDIEGEIRTIRRLDRIK